MTNPNSPEQQKSGGTRLRFSCICPSGSFLAVCEGFYGICMGFSEKVTPGAMYAASAHFGRNHICLNAKLGRFLIWNTVIVGANCVRPHNWANFLVFSGEYSSPLRILQLFSRQTNNSLDMGRDSKKSQNHRWKSSFVPDFLAVFGNISFKHK